MPPTLLTISKVPAVFGYAEMANIPWCVTETFTNRLELDIARISPF